MKRAPWILNFGMGVDSTAVLVGLYKRGERPEVDVGENPSVRDMDLHGYVKFRGFKNGNAHLTFLKPDLVDQLNKIIAKRFPNALPPARGDE